MRSSDFAAVKPWEIKIPPGVVASQDGTVTGPEFKIEGQGCKAGPFISRLKALLENHAVEVDEGCSFHIHLSVPGITHTYGAMFQVYLMEYLLNNKHRVPKGVLQRWQKSTEYCQPHVSSHKYSFVHFHTTYRTWEFRCFGNVSTASEALACFKLAVEALQWGYQCQLGLAKSRYTTTDQWKPSNFQTYVKDGHAEFHKRQDKVNRVNARNAG